MIFEKNNSEPVSELDVILPQNFDFFVAPDPLLEARVLDGNKGEKDKTLKQP